MANPTTYFGWVMPTATDLVTDLPADFNVFGQGVDTSLQYLLGGTSGQVLSKTSNTNMAFTWVTPQVGDITAVTAGTGISGGGTGGDVTITNSMATAIDAKGDLIAGTGADAFSRLAVGTNNQVLTADSAQATGMKWATPSSTPTFVGCSLTQSTNSQSISNATWTATTFDTEVLDTNGFHSLVTNTSRITIPTGYAGKYLINYGVTFATASATGARYGQIYKNGVTLAGSSAFATPTSGFAPGANNSIITSLSEADYIEAYIYQSSGSSMNMDNSGQSFSVQYLGA
jgi:hypothetical protein